MTELLRELKGESITACRLRPAQLAGLVKLIEAGTISGKIGKAVFLDMLATGDDAGTIIAAKNLAQVSDSGELLAIVREIVAANPAQAEDFRGGKSKLMGYFVGQLMQKTKGQANPQLANELFSQVLSEK
jgi:aspartyl-tRNA(Asn)/glutamyl-tRNA(Gln) amidotransferase subunit B